MKNKQPEDENFSINITWTVEDVKGRAEENDIKITTAEAIAVLKVLKVNHDCNEGISWETIDYYLDYLKSECPF